MPAGFGFFSAEMVKLVEMLAAFSGEMREILFPSAFPQRHKHSIAAINNEMKYTATQCNCIKIDENLCWPFVGIQSGRKGVN